MSTPTPDERAKLRASELRRLDHAVDTINTMIAKHETGIEREFDLSELHKLKTRLTELIKNQHLSTHTTNESIIQTAQGY